MTSPYNEKVNKLNTALENVYLKKADLIDDLGDILDGMIELADIQLTIYNVPSYIMNYTYYLVMSDFSSESFANYGSIQCEKDTNNYLLYVMIPFDFELDTLRVTNGGFGSTTRVFTFPSDLTPTNKQISVDFNNLIEQ